MFVEFIAWDKRIFEDQGRLAFYYPEGTKLDLPEEWAREHIARNTARQIDNPKDGTTEANYLPPSLGDDLLTVACVYKRGDSGYDSHDYVGKLARAVARNLTVPYRFVCLTDAPLSIEGVTIIPLENNWPKYWSKIELYRPGLFTGPVLFLDLDMIVCGTLNEFVGLTDPLVLSTDMNHAWINSSVMMRRIDLSCVYEAMFADPAAMFAKYDNGDKYGDQGLLQDVLIEHRIGWRWFQDLIPGQLWWQPNAHRSRPALGGVRVVNWCGFPKQHQVNDSTWLKEHWR